MWISKKRYKKLLQEFQENEMDAKYWKESFEETYEKYLDCLSYKYKNNKIWIIDKFKDELMDEFLSLCDYNDFNKIDLITIDDAVNRIYEKCVADMLKEKE